MLMDLCHNREHSVTQMLTVDTTRHPQLHPTSTAFVGYVTISLQRLNHLWRPHNVTLDLTTSGYLLCYGQRTRADQLNGQ